ncbi:MAG: peptidoglycan-binding protein [Patescibacteria group bacterium]
MLQKLILRAGIACLLVVSLLAPGFAGVQAESNSSLQAQITALLAIIAQLQAQLVAQLGGQVCVELDRNLYYGLNDTRTAGQVSKLQKFLKVKGDFTYPTITGFFGAATQLAVQRFQKRIGLVSYGTPASTGFGFVGPTTRAKIKTESCGASVPQDPNQPPPVAPPLVPPVVPPPPPPPPPTVKQCNDRLDNDSDGLIDYPSDPGCRSFTDNSEDSDIPLPPPTGDMQCGDGIDNDNDDVVDYPYEPGCSSAGDDSERNDPLLLIHETISDDVWNINDGEGLGGELSYIIYGQYVDPENDGTVNVNMIEQYIRGETPYSTGILSNFRGYVSIDIELPYLNWLRLSPTSSQFQQAQSQMILAIETAKRLRPNAKWGFYGLPTVNYWIDGPGGRTGWASAPQSVKDTYITQMLAPTALYNKVDYLSPSIYDHYPSDTIPQNIVEDNAWIQNLTRASVRAANGKPVFTFISPRFFNGSEPFSYSLVPPNEFQQQQIGVSLQNGADGIIWWGADRHSFCSAFSSNCDPSGPEQNLARTNFSAELSSSGIAPPYFYNRHAPSDPRNAPIDNYLNRLHEYNLRYIAEELYGLSFNPSPPFFYHGGDAGGGAGGAGGSGGTGGSPVNPNMKLSGLGFLEQLANVLQAFLNFLKRF